ncbi:MAG: Holliday junction branch migration protein RuvA [Planctomycetota bacterium]
MFDSITGTLVRKDSAVAVIMACGIGYGIRVPLRTLQKLLEGEETTLYCHLAVRDDSLVLYGFQEPSERNLFLKIMSVSGIGAATALNILSDLPPQKFLEAIAQEKASLLQKIKKVGARTAKRLILDLKGKVDLPDISSSSLPDEDPDSLDSALIKDLVAALISLGYPRKFAREAALGALASCPGIDNLETLIKSALRSL